MMSIETLDKGCNILRSATMRLENDELYLQVKKEKAISGYGRTKTISSLVDQTKRRFFFCDGVFTSLTAFSLSRD